MEVKKEWRKKEPSRSRKMTEEEKTGLALKQLKLELRMVKPKGRKIDNGKIV